MSDTLLNVSQFQVRSYSIANNYEYKYKKCTSSNICQDYSRTVVVDPTKYGVSKKILAIDVFFNLDQSSYYYQTRKSSSSFINDFVNVRAVKNGNSKEYTVNNITPNDLNGVWLLAVDNEIENADKLDLLVTIHGKNYVMNLK